MHGRVEPFDGDLEDYARWLAAGAGAAAVAAPEPDAGPQPVAVASAAPPPPAPARAAAPAGEGAEARRQRRREGADARARLAPLRAEVERCERELERLTRERADVEAALAASGIYADAAKAQLRELLARQAALAQQVGVAEAAWLAASERLETTQAASA